MAARRSIRKLREQLYTRWREIGGLKRRNYWWALVGLASFSTLLWVSSKPLLYLLARAAEGRMLVQSFGPLAPVVYMGLFAVQILLAPLPGQFLGVAGGYLFGIFWGSLYGISGMALGAGLAMFIGRRFGRAILARFGGTISIEQWERKLQIRSPVTWGLLFLFPVPDLVFYVAGMSSVPFGPLLAAVICGRGVGLLFSNLVGGLSASLPPEWDLVKWVVMLAAALAIFRYQRQLRWLILISVRVIQRQLRSVLFYISTGFGYRQQRPGHPARPDTSLDKDSHPDRHRDNAPQ